MKNYKFNTGEYQLVSPGPGTVEEFDKVAGEGACLEEGVTSIIYRAHIPSFWDKFIPLVEKLTGITRGADAEATAKARTRSKTPDKVKDIPEKFGKYDARVRATWAVLTDTDGSVVSDPEKIAQLNALAAETAAAIFIDVAEKRRAAGPGPAFLAKADSVLTRSSEAIEDTVNKLLLVVPDFEVERDELNRPTRESLADLIKRYTDASI